MRTNENQKNNIVINILEDIPYGVKAGVVITIILLLLASIAHLIEIYAFHGEGPIALSVQKFDNKLIGSLIMHIACGILYGIITTISVWLVWTIIDCIHTIYLFLQLEEQISSLPDDYFTKYQRITSAEFLKLLEPFRLKRKNGEYYMMEKVPYFLVKNEGEIAAMLCLLTNKEKSVIQNSVYGIKYPRLFGEE